MGQIVSTTECTPYTLNIPENGKLKGLSFRSSRTGNNTCHRFAQVPYAYPCEGKNRFTLPKELPLNYDYTGDYTELGLKCPQPAVSNPNFRYAKSPSKEFVQYNNIWIPSSDKDKPKNGWPVLIFIHGGWLQYGTPNSDNFNIVEMFDDDEFQEKFILVVPGYRLNIFGFLSCKELLEENPMNSNFGFWDQRMSIEWTYKNIKHFGGDPDKITVGGISAGSYSAFFQLAYELYNSEALQIIKQIIFLSNMVYIQPKKTVDLQDQFDEIIKNLNIDPFLSSTEKIQKLRELDTDFIEDFIPKLSMPTFRAVTDGNFISPNIIRDINSGKFCKMMVEKKIRVMNGEVDNECYKYSLLNTPLVADEIPIQVKNYYPNVIIPTLLNLYEANKEDFENISTTELKEQIRIKYGNIVGEGQVYASARGFLNKLVENGFPEKNIFRYRISFRSAWLDEYVDKRLKVLHGLDISVWFYNLRKGYTKEEAKYLNRWLTPYVKFLNFYEVIDEWPTSDIKKFRVFNSDGSDEYVEDPDWDWGVEVSNAVYMAQL